MAQIERFGQYSADTSPPYYSDIIVPLQNGKTEQAKIDLSDNRITKYLGIVDHTIAISGNADITTDFKNGKKHVWVTLKTKGIHSVVLSANSKQYTFNFIVNEIP